MNQYSTLRGNSKIKLKKIYKEEGSTLSKTASESKHMMRSPKGWAIDKYVLLSAVEKGLTDIVISEVERGLCYRAKLQDFLTRGVEVNYHNFGEQIVLPLKFWQITSPGRPYVSQLSLPL